MQKLGLSQSLQQKLSPQQIQFIKLLQVPTAELETRIEEELEINPALEEGETELPEEKNEEPEAQEQEYEETSGGEEELDINDYLRDDDYSGYKMQGDGDGDSLIRYVIITKGRSNSCFILRCPIRTKV